jgi:hypothetical protein
MNYIAEIRAFFVKAKVTDLSTGQRALWFALMETNNICAWSEWFSVTNCALISDTGLSKSGIEKARNALKQKGFIDFRPNGPNAPRYKMISQIPQKD